MPLLPSEAPFDDVCLHIQSKDPSSKLSPEQVGEAIRRTIGGLSQCTNWSIDGAPRLSLHSARSFARSRGEELSLIEGVANLGEEAVTPGPRAHELLLQLQRRAASEARLRGHFTGVYANQDRLVFFTDWLGFSHLYRIKVAGHELVSNRLHLLVEVLRTLKRLRFRPDQIAQSFAMDTTFTHDTPIQGLSLVPANRFLEVNAKGVHERRRYDLAAESLSLGPSDYSDLIRQAAVEIQENWVAGASLAGSHPCVLYLTGGIDSRIVLAGAKAAGVAPWYYTYGAKDCDDRRIAALLAEESGLKRLEDGGPQEPSVDAAIERWLSLNYHQRAASLLAVPQRASGRVRFCGGVGECTRGFYSRMFQEKLSRSERPESAATLADALATVVGNWSFTAPEIRAFFVEDLERFIETEPLVMETSAAADAFYSLFRNRFHFGLDLRMNSADSLKLAPLYSPSAQLASLLCDYDGRRHGKVAYDLLQVLAPELLKVEFEHGGFDPAVHGALPALSASPLESKPPRTPAARAEPPHLRRRQDEFDSQLLARLQQDKAHLKGQEDSYFLSVKRAALMKQIDKAEKLQDFKRARGLVMRVRLLREVAGSL